MIGYYVHHQGLGHRTQALAIALHLRGGVTGLSSLERPHGWPGEWVVLPRDDDPPPPREDLDAGGALHWAPAGHAGLRARMARIAAWVQRARPRLVVVDVSVEVALFVRLMGVPVVVVALPGRRDDEPHRAAFRVARSVLAAWPAWASPLRTFEPVETLHPVGALSRFDGRARCPAPDDPRRRRVLLLTGAGGHDLDDDAIRAAARATPDWDWQTPGLAGQPWLDDPWPQLSGADVVITHAGLGAIGEVAAARVPAIVIPQDRPYGEQHHTAGLLADARLASVRDRWPASDAWPGLLDATARQDGRRWARWSDGAGAQHAAEHLDQLAAVAP
jgi:hypothetical protein